MSDVSEVRDSVERPGWYVKKKIPINALQFVVRPGYDNFDALFDFTGGQVQKKIMESASAEMFDPVQYQVYDYLHTTWVNFKPGDWIMKGVQGEFYPCEEQVFIQSYEEISMDDKIIIDLENG